MKRADAFKQKLETVETIMKELSDEYHKLTDEEKYRFHLSKRICAKVQLTMCVSKRKAREYIMLVKDRDRFFNG